MPELKVDSRVAGARFSPHEFSWNWQDSQLIARAAGCSIADPLDRPLLWPESGAPGHPMIVFNGALLARNRPEVMDRLIGGYDNWQRVGRWGSTHTRFLRPPARAGHAAVECGFTETGVTSKGHALVRFAFEVNEMPSGERLADGWMLLFLLGCGSAALGKLAPPSIAMPERGADVVVAHETPVNVTFDWAMASADWNTTHFETREGNPAPLVYGTRNMALVIGDAARVFAAGAPARLRQITLGNLAAPLYPQESTETRMWREGAGRILARLVVPPKARIDGGAGEKIVIDQIEIHLD